MAVGTLEESLRSAPSSASAQKSALYGFVWPARGAPPASPPRGGASGSLGQAWIRTSSSSRHRSESGDRRDTPPSSGKKMWKRWSGRRKTDVAIVPIPFARSVALDERLLACIELGAQRVDGCAGGVELGLSLGELGVALGERLLACLELGAQSVDVRASGVELAPASGELCLAGVE